MSVDKVIRNLFMFQSRCSGFCFFYSDREQAMRNRLDREEFQSRCSGFCFFYKPGHWRSSQHGTHTPLRTRQQVSIPLLGILFFLRSTAQNAKRPPTNSFNPVARDFVFSTIAG